MMVCPNGHQLAAADHYCRWCGAARPGGDFEPSGQYARPGGAQDGSAARDSAGYQRGGGYWVGDATQASYRPVIGPYQPPLRYRPPVTNGLAIASLILGLIWFYWIGSVLAVILGLVSLRQIRDRDEDGKGLAVAGITLGVVGILAMVLVGLFAFAAVHQQQNIYVQGPVPQQAGSGG
jgi:hypothetical protein